MEGDIDIVSRIYGEAHRCRSICPHELVSTEDREDDMHDEIFRHIVECDSSWLYRHLAEPMNPSFEFSSEYRTIELEGLLSLMCEVEIGGSIRHRGFGLGSMSFYFLLLRSYFMDEWSH